jgi:hypothetical protein
MLGSKPVEIRKIMTLTQLSFQPSSAHRKTRAKIYAPVRLANRRQSMLVCSVWCQLWRLGSKIKYMSRKPDRKIRFILVYHHVLKRMAVGISPFTDKAKWFLAFSGILLLNALITLTPEDSWGQNGVEVMGFPVLLSLHYRLLHRTRVLPLSDTPAKGSVV